MPAADFYRNPLFGAALTVGVYACASALYRRVRWLPPLLPTCGCLMLLLYFCRIPYASYKVGGDLISFFLGPATIALGLPLYKQSRKISRHLPALLAAVTAGSAAGMAGAALFTKLAGGSRELVLSMLPKSVTTPISMEVSRQLGGLPDLTAALTVLSGLLGSVAGPPLLRLAGVRRDLPIGAATGAASHGIGTARLLRDSELQGGVSGLALALAGIVTSLLAIPVGWWIRG